MNAFSLTVAACLALLAGTSPHRQDPAPPSGIVLATFRWDGDAPPETAHIEVATKTAQGCVADGKSVDDIDRSLLVGPTGGIANVVFTLTPSDGKIVTKPRGEPFVLNQVHCRYEPHVLVVPRGAQIEYSNSDPINHNIHSFSRKNEAFNNSLAGHSKDVRTLEEVETILVKCDIHNWMGAYVVVTDAPFFGVSGPDGSVRIDGIPAGIYHGTWWHEKLGKGKLDTVVVDAEGITTIERMLKPRERKHRHH